MVIQYSRIVIVYAVQHVLLLEKNIMLYLSQSDILIRMTFDVLHILRPSHLIVYKNVIGKRVVVTTQTT